MEPGTQYPGAFTALAQSPNAALAAKILAAADKLNAHELIYSAPEGEAVTAPTPAAGHILFSEHPEEPAASQDRPRKKGVLYKHPLAIEGQTLLERTNENRAKHAGPDAQSQEELARQLHDFHNEVMPFVLFLANILAEEVGKQRIAVDEESVARFLRKIDRANQPRPEQYDLPADFDPRVKIEPPPEGKLADDIAHFKKAKAGYVIAVDMLTTQLGAELSGQSLEGATTAELRDLSHLFTRTATHEEDEGTGPPPRNITPTARPERRPLEPGDITLTLGNPHFLG